MWEFQLHKFSPVLHASGTCIRYGELNVKLISGLCGAWKGSDPLRGLWEVGGSPSHLEEEPLLM